MKQTDNQDIILEIMEDKNIKKYVKGRLLGKGGFAQCYQFISQQTGKRYAAKIINKESLSKGKARQKLQSEIFIHKSMRHKNIVKFQHFFQDHQSVYILLELCSNNTLNEILKRRRILSEIQTKYYILQLIKAVHYIHSHKVIHRDLKLGNFFLSDQLEIKVGDFGLATTISYEGETRKTVCGTPNYIAPQILQNKKGHSYEVDIWSLGVITFALLFGKPPFQTNQVNNTYQKIKKCQFIFPKNSSVSYSARNFINRMLKINPSDRATISQLMNDDFLNLQEIPTNLPLSSLACPPSKIFIDQIKQKNMKLQKSKDNKLQLKMKQSEDELGLSTTRTAKNTIVDVNRDVSKKKKNQRSLGSLIRKVQTPNLNLLRKKINSNIHPQSNNQTKISILYFDDQPKYGLFYKLSNNCFGMRFNDSTYLISDSNFRSFRYSVIKQYNKEVEVQTFQIGQEKPQLNKKIKIITFFYKQFTKKSIGQPEVKSKQNIFKQQPSQTFYILAYFNTNLYYLFCLNNGIYQANFKDGSHIIIHNDILIFVGTNKKKIIIKNLQVGSYNEQIKSKYSNVFNFIKRLRKGKQYSRQQTAQLHKAISKEVDKENVILVKNASSKMFKGKQMIKRPFSSTSNLQLQRKVFSEYQSNK